MGKSIIKLLLNKSNFSYCFSSAITWLNEYKFVIIWEWDGCNNIFPFSYTICCWKLSPFASSQFPFSDFPRILLPCCNCYLYLGINPGPGGWQISWKALKSRNRRHINTPLMTRMWCFMCLCFSSCFSHNWNVWNTCSIDIKCFSSQYHPVMCWIIFSFSLYLRHVLSVVSRNDGRMCDVTTLYLYDINSCSGWDHILPPPYCFSFVIQTLLDIMPSFRVNSFELWGYLPTEIQTIDTILVTTQI